MATLAVPSSGAFDQRLARVYQQVVRARAQVEEMEALAAIEIPDAVDVAAMARLVACFGLSDAQVELVWAIVASSIDGRLLPHLEALGGAHARRGLSIAVYAMFAEVDSASLAQWLAAGNALVALGLVVAAEQTSPAARAYVASPRLVSFLRGEDMLERGLRIPTVPAHVMHDPSAIAAALAHGRGLIVIEGPTGSGRVTACAAVADVIVADAGADYVALRREALLRGMVPVLANVDLAERKDVAAFVDAWDGPVLATSSAVGVDLGAARAVVRIPWTVPDAATREALWTIAVAQAGMKITGPIDVLAHRYAVGPLAIERAVASVELMAPAIVDEKVLGRGLRHNIAERLAGLAQRVEVTQRWSDLVIADDIRDLIAALIGRVRHSRQVLEHWGFRKKIARGTGIAGLFSGPPGTGKTMVAGLIARELDLELYQVDLSKVVSKWVGETEKNLGRVFDAAEEGHGLLLFDEADSLFGSRTADVQSSNDRHANLEVNYLLQRVEAFNGITILTTNLETAIDAALKRRLASHVVFGAPDEDERATLWERQLCTGASPLDEDIDSLQLARAFPKMSGANIRNAVLSAAYLAAGANDPTIAQAHLLRSARAEYRSMGHVIADSHRSL